MRTITHLHVCDCGRAEMVCHQEPDHCDVPVRWTCPHCTSDQLEADLNHMEALESTRTAKDKTNESI